MSSLAQAGALLYDLLLLTYSARVEAASDKEKRAVKARAASTVRPHPHVRVSHCGGGGYRMCRSGQS
jgi:hypothetical protein